jgi:hypothetical protein
MNDLEPKSVGASRMPVQLLKFPSAATATDCATMFRVVRPSPAVIITASTILGAATFIAVPLLAQTLLAQNGETPKPGESGKGEPGKPEGAKPEGAKPEAAKGEAAKGESPKGDATKEAAGRSGEAEARTLAGPAGRSECVWLGERAVGLMWKDDLDTSFRHLDLYDRFGCPGEHIQVSFRCVVRQGNPQKDPKGFDYRVHACWMDPAHPAEPATSTAAAVEKPETK